MILCWLYIKLNIRGIITYICINTWNIVFIPQASTTSLETIAVVTREISEPALIFNNEKLKVSDHNSFFTCHNRHVTEIPKWVFSRATTGIQEWNVSNCYLQLLFFGHCLNGRRHCALLRLLGTIADTISIHVAQRSFVLLLAFRSHYLD